MEPAPYGTAISTFNTICRQDYHMQHPMEPTMTILFPTFPYDDPEPSYDGDDMDRGWERENEQEATNEIP